MRQAHITSALFMFAIAIALSGGSSVSVLGQDGAQLGELGLDVNSAGEADVEITATITRSGDTAGSLVVKLTSSDLTELFVPATVTIPAGKTSAGVTLQVVNDGDIDGPQSVTVSASATGYADVSKEIEVSDDDMVGRRTLGGHLFGKIVSDKYVVLSEITVDEGQTLEIEPGSILGFRSNIGLTAHGSLVAVGEPGKEILFTRQGSDNTEGVADWRRARVILPADDYWQGVKNSGGAKQDSKLTHVVIQFAKTGLTVDGIQSHILLSNSCVSQNSGAGILIDNPWLPQVQIVENKIHHNGADGIDADAESCGKSNADVAPVIKGNEIYANQRGIYLHASSCDHKYPGRTATMNGDVRANYIHHNESGIEAHSTRQYGYWVPGGWGYGNYTEILTPIRNNIVVNNGGIGISLTMYNETGLASSVVNNTVVGNAGPGILHSADVKTGFAIENNIVFRNGAGIATESAFDPNKVNSFVASYNDVVDNNDSNWVNYPVAYGGVSARGSHGTPLDFAMNMSVDPCFVEIGHWDPNGTPGNLDDDVWIAGDYHLKSSAGRWDPVVENWVTDDVTSPCIDAGDPEMPVGDEPEPNGGRINMGAYGGTSEASLSPQ
jgi:hypothetical protein